MAESACKQAAYERRPYGQAAYGGRGEWMRGGGGEARRERRPYSGGSTVHQASRVMRTRSADNTRGQSNTRKARRWRLSRR